MNLKLSLLILLTCFFSSSPVIGQNVINGHFTALKTIIVDYHSFTENKSNDTIYIPQKTYFTEGVKFNFDTIPSICQSKPGCFGIRPFDLYQGYFSVEYLVFEIDKPLEKDSIYEIQINLKAILSDDKKESLNPIFGAKITNYQPTNKRIFNNEKVNISQLSGIYLPIILKPRKGAFRVVKNIFQAKGGENTIVLGSFLPDITNKQINDISKLKKKARKYSKTIDTDFIDYTRTYFGFLDDKTPNQILKFIETLDNAAYENPTYLIDFISIRKL